MFFWDPTFALLIPCTILALYAQSKVKRTYAKFRQVGSAAGLSGAETARRLLRENGIVDVAVEEVGGACEPEEDLLSQVRPGIDGLLLQEADHRSTPLPAVWQVIGEPATFLRELKQKAGLEPDYWSDDVRMFRYTTESIP